MKLRQLFEAKIIEAETPQGVVCIYAGRFHPFHKGHKAVFDAAVKAYGMDNCFIATSNKTDGNKSPFTFEEKKAMMVLTGVPENRIVECKVPYQPKEILDNFDSASTVAKFMVGAKDMDTDPRFSFSPKKDGSPSYLQDADAHRGNYETFDKHAYVVTAPTLNFKVLGQPATSASELRAQYVTLDDETAKQFIQDLFGNFDESVMNIMDSKLNRNAQETPAQEENLSLDEALDRLFESVYQDLYEEEMVRRVQDTGSLTNFNIDKSKPATVWKKGQDTMTIYATPEEIGKAMKYGDLRGWQKDQASGNPQPDQGSEDNMDDEANTGVPAQQAAPVQQAAPAPADDEGDDEDAGDASYMANTDAEQATNQAQVAAGGGAYKIQPGDNLTKIAKANGTTVDAIMKANPQIKDPNKIQAGATLNLPGKAAEPAAEQPPAEAPKPATEQPPQPPETASGSDDTDYGEQPDTGPANQQPQGTGVAANQGAGQPQGVAANQGAGQPGMLDKAADAVKGAASSAWDTVSGWFGGGDEKGAAPGGAAAPANQQQPQNAQQAQATAGKPVQPDPNAQKAQGQGAGAQGDVNAKAGQQAPAAAPATPAGQNAPAGRGAQTAAQSSQGPADDVAAGVKGGGVAPKQAPAQKKNQPAVTTTKTVTKSGGGMTATTTKSGVADYSKAQQQADSLAADVAEIDQEIADAQAAGDAAKVAELQKEKASLTGGQQGAAKAAPKVGSREWEQDVNDKLASGQYKASSPAQSQASADAAFADMDAGVKAKQAAKPQASQAQAQPQATQTQTQKAPVDTKAGGANKNLSPPGPDGLQTLKTSTKLPQGYTIKYDPKKGNYIGVRPDGKGFIRSKNALRVIDRVKAHANKQGA